MIKRTIDISEGPTFLFIENDQLVLHRDKAEVGRIPCEDIGVLLLDSRSITFTHSVITRLASHGAVVIFCGEDHLPASFALPMVANDLLTARLRVQIAASVPMKKNLWKQIVQHKIRGQEGNLREEDPARLKLLNLADEVKSGDTSNCEGLAAKFYWRALMGESFRRDPEGPPPNALLNYGYMVFRAAIARALVAGGLNPALGLQHSNRNNAFCLADDLVEVFRPRVDRAVVGLLSRGITKIDRDSKREILSLLSEPVMLNGESGPLMVSLHRIVASLLRCLEGTQKRLDLPE